MIAALPRLGGFLMGAVAPKSGFILAHSLIAQQLCLKFKIDKITKCLRLPGGQERPVLAILGS